MTEMILTGKSVADQPARNARQSPRRTGARPAGGSALGAERGRARTWKSPNVEEPNGEEPNVEEPNVEEPNVEEPNVEELGVSRAAGMATWSSTRPRQLEAPAAALSGRPAAWPEPLSRPDPRRR